jgi:hypothetical protein
LWIGWGCSRRKDLGAFDELTSFEAGSGSDQGHEVGAFTVHQPQAEPAISRGWR